MVSKCQSQSVKDIRAMPIEEVAMKMGIEVGRHKALCPFHQDRHPSLHFDIKRNRYKCFSCGASGNVIDLVMRYMNIGFKEAVEWMGAPPPPGGGISCPPDTPAALLNPPPGGRGAVAWGSVSPILPTASLNPTLLYFMTKSITSPLAPQAKHLNLFLFTSKYKLGCLSPWKGQSAKWRTTLIPNSSATPSIGVALISRSHWLSLRSPNVVSSFFILHSSFKRFAFCLLPFALFFNKRVFRLSDKSLTLPVSEHALNLSLRRLFAIVHLALLHKLLARESAGQTLV